jgi:hypothetical protein
MISSAFFKPDLVARTQFEYPGGCLMTVTASSVLSAEKQYLCGQYSVSPNRERYSRIYLTDFKAEHLRPSVSVTPHPRAFQSVVPAH